MTNLRSTIQGFMSPEERQHVDCFAVWAFGDKFMELNRSLKLMNEWNKLHGDCLYLMEDGSIDQDIPKMLQLWRYAKEN